MKLFCVLSVSITKNVQQTAQTRLCWDVSSGGTNHRKLKRNASFVGVKTNADVSSWACDVGSVFWASVCCRFSSVAAVSVLTSPALRWKTHFFGASGTTLTWADAISVRIGEICQLTAIQPHLKVLSKDRPFYTVSFTIQIHSPLWMSLYCLLFSSSIFFL